MSDRVKRFARIIAECDGAEVQRAARAILDEITAEKNRLNVALLDLNYETNWIEQYLRMIAPDRTTLAVSSGMIFQNALAHTSTELRPLAVSANGVSQYAFV